MDVPQAGRLLHVGNFLHENGAVAEGLFGAFLRDAVSSVVAEGVQRHRVVRVAVHERNGLDVVASGAGGAKPVTELGEGKGGV